MKTNFIVFIAFILDLILGDPYWLYHPVRLIGALITKLEKIIKNPKTDLSLFISGMLLVFIVLLISFFVPFFILLFCDNISLYLKIAVNCFLCYQIIAAKCLKLESMKIYNCLKLKDITNAKKYLSYIVGRDTQNLTEQQIIKATIETISENTCDGVVAPIIYMLIGGAPLGFLYKAINTMDSMIGYKNDKYIFFGKFAAKLDDIANFIPAIVSAYLMIFSSFLLKLDYKNAYKIYNRDKYNHASPNSAKTESVCAGALNICLAGDTYYFGKLVKKPTIGDFNKIAELNDIKRAINLMYVTSILIIFLGVILL